MKTNDRKKIMHELDKLLKDRNYKIVGSGIYNNGVMFIKFEKVK